MSTRDYDSDTTITYHKCGHWIGVCTCPKDKEAKHGKGRWCIKCQQYSIYYIGDHWECLNYPGGHDFRLLNQAMTEDTKTWNQK
jgi:hypothetical protein